MLIDIDVAHCLHYIDDDFDDLEQYNEADLLSHCELFQIVPEERTIADSVELLFAELLLEEELDQPAFFD